MCLYNVDKTQQPTDDVISGYRVFIKQGQSITTLNDDRPIPRGKWIASDKRRGTSYSWGECPAHDDGFYGFEEKDGTVAWTDRPHVVLKVKFRKVHTFGHSFGWDAFVADEMFVPLARKKPVRKTKPVKKARRAKN